MNTTLRLLVAVSTLGLSFHACADSASINYRHGYTEDDSIHSDRIKLSYRKDSGLGFAAEIKYKTAGDREDVAYDNMVNNGHEFTIDYNYKLSAQSTLTPAFQMDSSKDSTTYKFGLKYSYKVSDTWYVAGRVRRMRAAWTATRSTMTGPTVPRTTRTPHALKAGWATRPKAPGRSSTSTSTSRPTTSATTTRRATTNRT